MLCAAIDSSGVVVVTSPQPDNVSTCPVVILSPADMANNPFNLSAGEGLAVAAAIVLVWGTAFGFRALIRSLSLEENHHEPH